ncbi:MAG: enoyl-CoA hydratase/isomerase family protein [Candidatus Rokubacteria bacterium]|nr:enoyl-CoA hydratase/isomerase family protein [Candidatus Rokubacteria bacterium]
MNATDVLLRRQAGGVLTLTLNRPKKLNAMSYEVFEALDAAVGDARGDRAVRVVVVTGAGPFFSAGADISMVREFSDPDLPAEAFRTKIRRLQSVFDRLEQLEKPVVAAINGPCVGGAVDLVLACDLRIAAEEAFFLVPEVRLGLIPDLGATQRLPRIVGVGRAKEMILTGRRFTAEECRAMGLVNRVVPLRGLEDAVAAMAAELQEGGPLAVGAAKQAIDLAWATDLRSGEEFEAFAQAPLYRSQDAREGYAAFVEKRAPRWTGR